MKVTIGDMINYIEENKYEQSTGSLVVTLRNTNAPKNPQDVLGACAVGQGLLNLWKHHPELSFGDIRNALYQNRATGTHLKTPVQCPFDGCPESSWSDFIWYVVHLNDTHKLTIPAIVESLKITFARQKNRLVGEV